MKKKIIPVLLAIVLILVIFAVAFGEKILEKYSYSNERADLNSYFNLENDNDVAIILQDQRIEEKAKMIAGTCYFDIDTVKKYFTDRFYINEAEKVLLFTTDKDVIKIMIGDESNVIYVSDIGNSLNYKAAVYEGETLYIAVDYVKKYANFSYSLYDSPMHMQVYNEWSVKKEASLNKKTKLRVRGGIKSEILEDLEEGATVLILEEMENWTKVKTQDSYIGYIENKFLTGIKDVMPQPVTDAVTVEVKQIKKDGIINMAFHQVFAEQGGNDLKNALQGTKAVNVVAPTWFRLKGSEGDFSSLANASYIKTAHEMGVDVWAVMTDVDSEELYGEAVNYPTLMSSSDNRRHLIAGLIDVMENYEIDGINLDLELVKRDAGEDFIQFIRELSIETHKRNVILSIDNYVPTEYTAHYNRKEQGLVADYLVVMGYDEYYSGIGQAGSNASIDYIKTGIEKTKQASSEEKVINAIPFYTRVWESSDEGTSASMLTMSNQSSWVAKTGVTPVWSDECGQNVVEYNVNGKTYQCWLEDEESVREKLNVMKSQNIAGVAEWKLGIEDKSIWNVISEYVNGEM